MDRNKSLTLKSFKGNVADHGNGRSFTMTTDNSLKITSDHSWDFGTNRYYGVDLLGGFSWPPRSYTCSFCKREFKSAQALGGHMNVHRRDRARLRQSPPWETQLSSNLETRPEPNVSPYIPSAKQLLPFSFTHPTLCTASNIASLMCSSTTLASSADHHEKVIEKEMGGIKTSTSEDLAITMKALKELKEDDCKDLEREEILMLDLDIGLCSNSNEDLDLELRLGYA